MARLAVTVNQDQWNTIAQLTMRLENEEISEEEYADSLMMVLGPSLPRRPAPDDHLQIKLEPKIMVGPH
jgi:hypothetical protein